MKKYSKDLCMTCTYFERLNKVYNLSPQLKYETLKLNLVFYHFKITIYILCILYCFDSTLTD